ncbi:MAG: hypothetical protein QXE31_00610 [Candidatus Woesearchaeota archaeon]
MKKECKTTNKKLTPIQVRDAIIDCFLKAHQEALNNVQIDEELREKFNKNSVVLIMKDAFKEAGSTFENPTKEILFFSLFYLAKLARNFRNIDIITKHFLEMLKLIDKL